MTAGALLVLLIIVIQIIVSSHNLQRLSGLPSMLDKYHVFHYKLF